ncbi:MAG: cation transporter [Dehalococcoidia bacterium]|nr:cation transporter [Dehalococcoidia bacterium]
MNEKYQHDSYQASRNSLMFALALTACYMVVEVVGGLRANSLSLLADAGHMVTDAASLLLALLAIWVATRPASAGRTFGFQRAEVLAALLNAVSLWIIAGWIFFEAYRRFLAPIQPQAPLMVVIGLAGLVVNAPVALILKRSAGRNVNVEGAFLHVIGDLLGSIGVVVAGGLTILFGWSVADPIFGAITACLILVSSTRLLWRVTHVLMEGTPHRRSLPAAGAG